MKIIPKKPPPSDLISLLVCAPGDCFKSNDSYHVKMVDDNPTEGLVKTFNLTHNRISVFDDDKEISVIQLEVVEK